MVFKKIDSRIKTLIENGVENKQRTMFVIVGDKAKDQVSILYNILAKSQIKARPSVLWCYKNELEFKNNRKKRLERIQKKLSQGLSAKSDNLFDLFIESSKIRFTYYKDCKKILGNTYGMLVLQDFEALTPNIMATTIETIEGGGIVCFLLSSVKTLRQLYTITMDVHARYRTESFQDIVHRFNERFMLSLNDCISCVIIDDNINILPIFSKNLHVEKVHKHSIEDLTASQLQLKQLCHSFNEIQPIGTLLGFCKTIDQANTLCKSFELVSHLNAHAVISITAARGRGKSAILGLIVSGAIAAGLSNIYVIAPGPENLVTFFEFVRKGLIGLGYNEKSDYNLLTSVRDNQKLITSIKITRNHRQNVQYIFPKEAASIHNAELIVCDEAAAIPLPYVKKLVGSHLLILSSTVNGYEGTGRSLSLKLIKELREGSLNNPQHPSAGPKFQYSYLTELKLTESIRYAGGDPVEDWLNKLLCMDELNVPTIEYTQLCSAKDCELFYVSRDTLFSYHKVAEMFLQNMTALFVSSHYKNSPNDLQMMADAPAHHLYVLLPSSTINKSSFPQILCCVQVCFEGGISQKTVSNNFGRGQRASGDLIPWTISQQFCEADFASLKGVRIVRIATHPDYTQMGYGTKAMELLIDYYEKGIVTIDSPLVSPENIEDTTNINLMEERLVPKITLPPLLINIRERPVEQLDYIGVSYGLTPRLLKFWKRLNFVPIYLRQTPNELTGEFTNIMIRPIKSKNSPQNNNWLAEYYFDFRTRFMSLLSYGFRDLSPSVALSLMYHDDIPLLFKNISNDEINNLLSPHDFKRLENYANNMVDFHFIMDLVPIVTKLHLNNQIKDHQNNWVQLSVILSMGLQYKSIESLEKNIKIPLSQILSMFNKIVRKTVSYLNSVKENYISRENVKPKESYDDEKAQDSNLPSAFNSYKITADDSIWNDALKSNTDSKNMSIPRPQKRKK
ncbi:hypothetical protein HZS_3122 [Henneguya salminicola]|nr:hypothetical protein HZS_3122 [Henneguya salminicola]